MIHLGWWLLACVGAPAPSVRAQPDLGPPAADEPQSEDPYGDVLRQAVTAYKAEQWALARELFESVHAKAPTARTARSIGLVAFRQGRYVEAIPMLEASLASTTLALTKDLRDSTWQVLQEAKSHVGQVIVQSEPTVTRIEVAGKLAVVDAHGAISLPPGSHRLTLIFEREAAETSHDVSVQVTAGQRQVLRLVLSPAELAAQGPASAAGRVVASEAQVVTTLLPSSSAAAPPTQPGGRRSADRSGLSSRWVAGWTLLGTGLVSLGVGSYFGVSSLHIYHRADRACPSHESCSRDALDDRELAQRRAWVANGTIGMGAALVVVGGVLLLTKPRARRNADVTQRAGAALRPTWRGVVLEGSF